MITVDVAAETEVATNVGARVDVEGPLRLRYALSAGWMPGPYLDLVNDVCVGFGWYDEPTAELIDVVLQDSLLVQNHVGWRPFPKHGFHVELGYGLVTLGGGVSGADILAIGTDQTLPPAVDERLQFDAKATLHMLDAAIGWEWVVEEHLLVRAQLGGAFTLASTTEIEPDFDVPRLAQDGVDQLTTAGEDYLDETFTTYVHTPTIGVAVGYRF